MAMVVVTPSKTNFDVPSSITVIKLKHSGRLLKTATGGLDYTRESLFVRPFGLLG